jgi:heme exporter protein D
MLPVSLDFLCFVSCAQCCLFLWIVFVLCLVPNVAHKTKTIQRNRQHWAQDTKQRQSRETGNIGHKTQNKDNPEKQATFDAFSLDFHVVFCLSLFCVLCPMLPVSLDCLCFVSCAQYCLFLWIVFVL